MSEDVKIVDTTGETCPIPLLETRKAVIRGVKGQVVEVRGDHAASRHEIPMALESMKCEILEVRDEPGGRWSIRFRV